MLKNIIFVSLSFLLLASFSTKAQQKKYPIIQQGGGIFEVPEAVPIADPAMKYKIVVELAKPSDKPDSVNGSLDKLARLVNLHIAAGIPAQNLEIIAVAHFLGTPIILSDEAYKQKFGMLNPNTKLIDELAKNGVTFYVCGQSLRAQHLENEKRNEHVKVVQSALLTLTTLQLKGFAAINP